MLSRKAQDGDLDSVKLLDKIDNRKKPTQPTVKKRTGLTYAQKMELEPEWEGPPEPDPRDAIGRDPDDDPGKDYLYVNRGTEKPPETSTS